MWLYILYFFVYIVLKENIQSHMTKSQEDINRFQVLLREKEEKISHMADNIEGIYVMCIQWFQGI